MCGHTGPPQSVVRTSSGLPHPGATSCPVELTSSGSRGHKPRGGPAPPLSAVSGPQTFQPFQQASCSAGPTLGARPAGDPPWGTRCKHVGTRAALVIILALPSTAWGPRESAFTSLGLIFLICEMGMQVFPTFGKFASCYFAFMKDLY